MPSASFLIVSQSVLDGSINEHPQADHKYQMRIKTWLEFKHGLELCVWCRGLYSRLTDMMLEKPKISFTYYMNYIFDHIFYQSHGQEFVVVIEAFAF